MIKIRDDLTFKSQLAELQNVEDIITQIFEENTAEAIHLNVKKLKNYVKMDGRNVKNPIHLNMDDLNIDFNKELSAELYSSRMEVSFRETF